MEYIFVLAIGGWLAATAFVWPKIRSSMAGRLSWLVTLPISFCLTFVAFLFGLPIPLEYVVSQTEVAWAQSSIHEGETRADVEHAFGLWAPRYDERWDEPGGLRTQYSYYGPGMICLGTKVFVDVHYDVQQRVESVVRGGSADGC